MSWNIYDGLIKFRTGPSRALGAWSTLGHLLLALSVLEARLPLVLLLPVLFAWLGVLRRALQPLGPGVAALAWSRARGWERIGLGTNRESMELRGSSVVTNGAMFLHWQLGGSVWRVLLMRDSMPPDDWRRMKVIVGLDEGRARMPAAARFATPAGRTSGTAPGHTEWRMDSPGFRGAGPNGHEKQRPVAGREGPAR